MHILQRKRSKQRDDKIAYLRKIQGSSKLMLQASDTLNPNLSIQSMVVQDEDMSHDSPQSKAPSESISVAIRRIK